MLHFFLLRPCRRYVIKCIPERLCKWFEWVGLGCSHIPNVNTVVVYVLSAPNICIYMCSFFIYKSNVWTIKLFSLKRWKKIFTKPNLIKPPELPQFLTLGYITQVYSWFVSAVCNRSFGWAFCLMWLSQLANYVWQQKCLVQITELLIIDDRMSHLIIFYKIYFCFWFGTFQKDFTGKTYYQTCCYNVIRRQYKWNPLKGQCFLL